MDQLIAQLNTLVADAQAALAAAQATPPAPVTDPNDALVTGIVSAFTTAGYTVTAPLPVVSVPVTDASETTPETPAEDATDTTPEA